MKNKRKNEVNFATQNKIKEMNQYPNHFFLYKAAPTDINEVTRNGYFVPRWSKISLLISLLMFN